MSRQFSHKFIGSAVDIGVTNIFWSRSRQGHKRSVITLSFLRQHRYNNMLMHIETEINIKCLIF